MSLFKLTEKQEEAVNNLSGNLQIIACAGSGKTEVVSRRVSNLIIHGANPSSIVAFTFTEKAAHELKARIREILDIQCPNRADIGDMYIGTIHSFCFEMLKELKPQYRGFDVLDDPRKVAFISMPRRFYQSHLKSLRINGKFNKYQIIKKFFSSCDIVRMENIDLDQISDEDFVEAYKRYEYFLNEARYFDFSSMIFRLVSLLDNDNNAKTELTNRIKHLIVDEYQDINQLQERLIQHISEGCNSLCVVGDDDQCIFNWRGSTVENIIDFSKNYSNVQKIALSTNFRSTKKIIDVTKKFVSRNVHRLEKDMIAPDKPVNSSENDDLFYYQFNHESEEFNFIIQRIKDLIKTDFKDKKGQPFSLSFRDFAILPRTNKEATKLVQCLEETDIPFVIESGDEVYNRPEVVLSLKCLAYIFNLEYKKEKVRIEELVDGYNQIFAKRYSGADRERFQKIIEEARIKVSKILAKKNRDYLSLGLQPYFQEILKAFGSNEYELDSVHHYNLAIVSQSISDYESVWKRLRASQVKYFFGFLQAYGSYAYTDSSHNDPTLINAVKILTIHRAKGLEFPVVFIPGFVKERKPRKYTTFVDSTLYDFNKYVGNEEDERRVYYTAMTRSMKYLFITGSKRRLKIDGSPYVYPFKEHVFAPEILDVGNFSNEIEIHRNCSGYASRKLTSMLFPTSFTDLNCYRRCGQDYLFRNVYGYQVVIPPAYGYGQRMHNILNIIYKNYISSKRIPSDPEIEQLFDEHFFLRYATNKITENMKLGGTKVIKNYVELNKEDFSRVLETEKKFELVQGQALITGVIDLLKNFDEHGDLKEVEVIDFKTEKHNDSVYDEDHEFQLRLYAMACLNCLGLKPKKAVIHHLDGEKGKNKTTEIDVSPPSLEKARKEVSQTISKIIDQKFNECASKTCKGCDWEKMCSQKK